MRIRITALLIWCPLMFLTSVAYGQAKKVSKAEAMANITSKSAPEYPPVARQLRIEGNVELEATVSETGTVEEVTIVSGNPVLTKPAAEALKRWKFTPFTEGGKPVKALAPVSMAFKL
jgi:protein TonB